MRRPLSRRWPMIVVGAAAGLLAVALVVQWFALPTAEAHAPAFQGPPPTTPPAFRATPVTPGPTPTPTKVVLPVFAQLTVTPVTATPPVIATPPAMSVPPAAATPPPFVLPPLADVNVTQVGPALLAEAERRQNMQFNPGAALQKRIFADGLVPNSPEFSLDIDGVTYGGQRAESLGSGVVRVYYVAVPDFANVMLVQRPNARTETETRLLSAGENAQVIQFNPNAALQKRMFADSFVPNSSEFRLSVNGVTFIGQRGERLDTGEVRVYFVRDGDFASVYFYRRS